MKKAYRNINEVACLFGIPKHTLLYWEKEGLLHFERDPVNNYRIATPKTIFDIETVLHLRALDVPIETIRALSSKSLETQWEMYTQAVERARDKIADLERICAFSTQMIEQIREMRMLEGERYRAEIPPFSVITEHSDRARAAEFNEPGRFALYFSKKNGYASCEAFIDDSPRQSEILWQRSDCSGDWIAFLLCVENVEGKRVASNLNEQLRMLEADGYFCGDVIAQYLAEEASQRGMNIYYKAYVNVVPTV